MGTYTAIVQAARNVLIKGTGNEVVSGTDSVQVQLITVISDSIATAVIF